MFAFSPDPSWSTGLKVPTNQLTSHQIGVSQSMKSMINVLKKKFLVRLAFFGETFCEKSFGLFLGCVFLVVRVNKVLQRKVN